MHRMTYVAFYVTFYVLRVVLPNLYNPPPINAITSSQINTNIGVRRLLPGHDGGAGQVEGGRQVRGPRGSPAGYVRADAERARALLQRPAHRCETASRAGEQDQQRWVVWHGEAVRCGLVLSFGCLVESS